MLTDSDCGIAKSEAEAQAESAVELKRLQGAQPKDRDRKWMQSVCECIPADPESMKVKWRSIRKTMQLQWNDCTVLNDQWTLSCRAHHVAFCTALL